MAPRTARRIVSATSSGSRRRGFGSASYASSTASRVISGPSRQYLSIGWIGLRPHDARHLTLNDTLGDMTQNSATAKRLSP
jgi:hypothetical protein